jgi:hydrogenase maturation protease
MTPRRVLVACVGNALRGDDGFGVAVAAALEGTLPEHVDLVETGIGGIGIIHALMDGYEGLVIVDAVERGAQPGTVFVLDPQVADIATPSFDEWRAQLAELHLAEPARILRIARAAGVLPAQVVVIGCQPETCEDFEEGLSRRVAAAVPVAAARVRRILTDLGSTTEPSPPRQPRSRPGPDRSAAGDLQSLGEEDERLREGARRGQLP